MPSRRLDILRTASANNRVMEERGRRAKHRGLEEKRAQVILLIEAGAHPDVVAAAFNVGRSTDVGWWSTYRQKGEEPFGFKWSPGGTTKSRTLKPLSAGRPRSTRRSSAPWPERRHPIICL